ncbi:MAG TPA: ATP-binding cassette domain-containing protein [Methylococcus sp.]|nr:ATP-binding cassette domain-containing protein [Methylococcus sp.]
MLDLSLQKRLHTAEGERTLDVSLAVESGKFVTLFGRSGAGKTTVLRCIAGLTRPERGRIVVDGEVWFDSERGIDLPPQMRKAGFVFQDYALFPHLSVRENLAIALADRREQAYVDELLDLTGIRALQSRLPATLSGGQQQQVALARALARRPRLLLLDEPLSALDAEMRARLQNEILTLQRRLGITTLMVSHTVAEVYKLSDRVFVIEAGRIVSQGKPSEVFGRQRISGKFQFSGEVLAIARCDVAYTLSVLVGNRIVQVFVTEREVADIRVGDSVLLVSKAFNPVVLKIHEKNALEL